ncbi:polysaccharide biosynthesis C-terminal domain-containing protein [Candidatus Micrarchaeota archaeon]|nr:polysaccharide biosynthesis C-terminal domain-containing protein [Candidatus Micrarchaeota archaeon]
MPVFYSIFIFNSYLQGQQKPIHFASILVLSDLLRLLISVFLVYYGLNLLGATASYAIGSLILFIPILLILYFRNKSNTKEYAFSLKANLIHVFPTYLLLAFLLTGDLFFVKYFADPESAGLYTAASTLARSIFFVSIGVMNAFLPQSSKFDLKKDLPKISKPLFISTLLLLMFSSGIYVTKDLLLSVLYGFEGSNLLIASSVLGALTISIFFLSVSILLINLLWSQNEQKIPLIISIFGVLIALIIMFWFANSNKPLDVAIASLIYNFILVVLCLAAVLKKYIFKLAPSPSRPN